MIGDDEIERVDSYVYLGQNITAEHNLEGKSPEGTEQVGTPSTLSKRSLSPQQINLCDLNFSTAPSYRP